MSTQSIGPQGPESSKDEDGDGVPDQVEADFAHDGQAQPSSDASQREVPGEASDRGNRQRPSSDQGLASTQAEDGTVRPPQSN